ncbi:MAG TPA: carboxypeptidase regulatory-like domain-containing protein [Candidatus Elarobacter sp.]|jgi:hypothetical protein
MKSIITAGIAAALVLCGCGSSHSVAPATPGKATTAQTHVRHLKNSSGQNPGRRPLDLLGGPPSFRLLIQLFDAPLVGANAANAQFNAGILGIDAIDSLGDSWQLIANDSPNVVNLLALQNTSLALGDGSLPAGTYPSVQLLLDPATTTVTYNGQTYPVRFTDPNHPWWDPAQTIEAVNVPLQVSGDGGQTLSATLDFNVFESANLSDGVVYLTPTVAGGIGSPTINGSVVNAAGQPVSNATVIATNKDGAVANTTITGADGSYHLRGINPGGYTISVVNTFTTKAGVTVTASGNDDGAAPSAYAVVGPDTQLTLATLRD